MPIDLSRLRSSSSSRKQTHPRELFRAQQKREPKKYEFPRDVQTQVWNAWHGRRTERDLVLKANTGSGKTIIGLFLLQSCLNEGVGPAVFFTPNRFLADQARREGEALGLSITDDPHDLGFIQGESILIVTAHKLFHGFSAFGVGTIKQEIGSLVVDDAHACLSAIEEQFTLHISSNNTFFTAAYKELYKALRDGLMQQSPSIDVEMKDGNITQAVEVPFWTWNDQLEVVRGLVHKLNSEIGKEQTTGKKEKDSDKDNIRFVWPLIRDDLENCRCVLGEDGFEITARVLPVEVIPSFGAAKRRVFMSATFADDSVLVSQFDVNPTALERLVVPDTANDIGDRMILVPQALIKGLDEKSIKAFVKRKSKETSVVVIVPSKWRADKFWGDVADRILNRDSLQDGVSKLRSSKAPKGLTVLVNQYDGVDLPDDACRILVLDGLPDVRRNVDRVDQATLLNSSLPRTEIAHRIEQGMGRATRSAEDFAAVLLMGSSLVEQLYRRKATERFTDATRAQMQLSEEVGGQIKDSGGTIDDVEAAIEKCLSRDSDWVRLSRDRLADLKYPDKVIADPIAVARRESFNVLRAGDAMTATATLKTVVEVQADRIMKGYLLQEVAAIQHHYDRTEAQKTLKRAKSLNRGVLRPVEGVGYQKLKPAEADQAAQAHAFLRSEYGGDGNALVVGMNAMLDSLVFQPGTHDAFEDAVEKLGHHLGFTAQRPELEIGRGPDGLWNLGGVNFAVIEAKNGAITDRISKDYCEQLGGSVAWFHDNYPGVGTATPIILHPVRDAARDATAPRDARVVTSEKLEELKNAVRVLAVAIATRPGFGTPLELAADLKTSQLNGLSIFERYAVPMRSSR
jgi:hypothetical protein